MSGTSKVAKGFRSCAGEGTRCLENQELEWGRYTEQRTGIVEKGGRGIKCVYTHLRCYNSGNSEQMCAVFGVLYRAATMEKVSVVGKLLHWTYTASITIK